MYYIVPFLIISSILIDIYYPILLYYYNYNININILVYFNQYYNIIINISIIIYIIIIINIIYFILLDELIMGSSQKRIGPLNLG